MVANSTMAKFAFIAFTRENRRAGMSAKKWVNHADTERTQHKMTSEIDQVRSNVTLAPLEWNCALKSALLQFT